MRATAPGPIATASLSATSPTEMWSPPAGRRQGRQAVSRKATDGPPPPPPPASLGRGRAGADPRRDRLNGRGDPGRGVDQGAGGDLQQVGRDIGERAQPPVDA